MNTGQLMAEAERARRNAHAPYSKFKVGAALLDREGRIFRGCNVENASFGLTVCAERVALWNALSTGARDFEALAVAVPRGQSGSPCGACRQVLAEFAPDLVVHFRDARGGTQRRTLQQLLPAAFGLRPARRR